MIPAFAPLRTILKPKRRVENFIFLLHSRITVIILVACSLVLTTKQLVGDPIKCYADKAVPDGVLENFCWITATFTVENTQYRRTGLDAVAPNVGPQDSNEEEKYHRYYQYVCFVLFIQAVFFYLPRYIWKMKENNLLESLCKSASTFFEIDKREAGINSLHQYFLAKHCSRKEYVVVYVVCEALNLINVIAQIWFTNMFLNGAFSDYGYAAVNYLLEGTNPDPMSEIFPKVTKCKFHSVGPTGSIQTIGALCILGLNILNEKIYVFLWFWFIILMVLSSLQLIYRLFSVFNKKCRFFVLRRISYAKSHHIQTITDYFDFGTLFILCNVGKNIDPVAFKMLLVKLANTINDKYKDADSKNNLDV